MMSPKRTFIEGITKLFRLFSRPFSVSLCARPYQPHVVGGGLRTSRGEKITSKTAPNSFAIPSINFLFVFVGLSVLVSCAWAPRSESYRQQYAYLSDIPVENVVGPHYEYSLTMLVAAKHLDYSDSQAFLKTMTKHPLDGCKDCSVGHSWIVLEGTDENGHKHFVEGGHSGEVGDIQPKYFEGMMECVMQGDPDPVHYLWEERCDGFWQKGNGGHPPTFAARVPITKEQYDAILTFIDPRRYPYAKYSLTKRQCAAFVVQVAALADIDLEADVTIPINQYARCGGAYIKVWSDPKYSQITLASPDILEKSLMELVHQGKAKPSMRWYKTYRHHHSTESAKGTPLMETIKRFPERYLRHRST